MPCSSCCHCRVKPGHTQANVLQTVFWFKAFSNVLLQDISSGESQVSDPHYTTVGKVRADRGSSLIRPGCAKTADMPYLPAMIKLHCCSMPTLLKFL